MIKKVQTLVTGLILVTMMMTNAWAEWRKDIGIFRVGVVSKQGIAHTIEHYEPFKRALARALEMDVEIFPARNESTLIQALSSDRIEYAILSTSGYALTWVLCQCVEPLVTARTIDSVDAYHTVVIAPVTGISKPKQLETAKIGVLAKNSISGHPLAKFLLAQENIVVGAPQSPFISHTQGSETLKAFMGGELDAIIGWSTITGDPTRGYSAGTLKQLGALNEGDAKPYRIIWNSPPLPYRPHVIAKKLHGEAVSILRTTLESMYDRSPVAYDVIEPDYSGGFIVSRHNRFEPLVELVQSLYQLEPEEVAPTEETVSSVHE